MRRQILNNTTYIESHLNRVLNVSYTLNQCREHHMYRSFCIVDVDDVINAVAAIVKLSTTSLNLVMTFNDQGAQ